MSDPALNHKLPEKHTAQQYPSGLKCPAIHEYILKEFEKLESPNKVELDNTGRERGLEDEAQKESVAHGWIGQGGDS